MGGQFWDQRAANLTEQAKGPFLNKLEMNNTDPAEVLNKINNSTYKDLFNNVCGNQSYPDGQYTCIASSIAAFENTPEMNRFSSKFDLDQPNMTLDEMKGFKLFVGKGKCSLCHPLGPTPSSTLFSDFDAENTGIPSNLGMLGNTTNLTYYFPFYYLAPEFNPAGLNFVDIGLAGNPNVPLVMQPLVKGAFKAPILRNVGLTAPYMHNGVFRDLKTVVHFYNTRDVLGSCESRMNPQPGVNCWPAPEVLPNMNTAIGNLQLTDAEENDIVAFLKTLTDGYVPPPGTSVPTPQEQLGKNLFFDINLSTPQGQGCVSCHDPAVAFTEPHKDRGVSEGAVPGRFGSRNAPSEAYQAFVPDFSLAGAGFVGGQFWDQRAVNLTEQAKGPFLNKLEMNNTNEAEVLNKIKNSAYADLFNMTCGNQSYPDGQYTCMASAIAAFGKTPELNSFSSKFDIDQANLTVQEMRGFNLFNGKAKCALCHPIAPFGSRSLFTDFDAENIGVPKNLGMMGDTPALRYYYPFYYLPEFNPAGLNFIDVGVAGNPNVPATLRPTLKGAMKAPSLRNVELTAPYMHNGVFRTLKEVVHFYNTRDILGNCAVRTDPQPGVNCWPAPEVAANMALGVGNLQLTDAEENDIVAFLKTLTDTTLIQDTTSPAINSVALSNTTPTAGSSILVTVNATDNVAVIAVRANGVSLASLGGNIWNGSFVALAGTNPVNVSASDAAGNVAWNNATRYTATAPLTFLKSIDISPSAAMLIAGENLVFNATAKDQNGAPMAGINISWTINNPAAGTVTPPSAVTGADGIASTTFTALTAGAAMINSTNGTIVGSASVTVTAQAHGQPLIPAGYYGNITVNGQPASHGTTIIAKIGVEERGNITTTASGTYGGLEGPSPKLWVKGFQGENGATVTFYVGGVAAQQTATWISGEIKQMDLTFVGVPVLNTIKVSPATATLSIGGTKLLTATAKDQNGIPMQGIIISWISSNANVGSIAPLNGITGADGNASATFTAVGVGTASVTASNGTVAGSATVSVAAGEAGKGGAGEVSRGGGGAGGGSVTSAEPPDNIERAYRSERDLVANVSVIFSFPPGEGGIYEIAVIGKENENDVAIRVEHLKGLSKLLKEPASGTVYYYVNIWSSTERIKEALIRFKVQNSWLDSNNIGNNDVKMLKWDGSKWIQLDLAKIKKDSTHTYFEAKTDTFSHFAVSGVKGAVATPPAVTPAKQVTPLPPVVPIEKAQGFNIIAIAILAAIALLAVYLWKVRR